MIWCDVRVLFPAAGRFLAALVLAGVAVLGGPALAHAASVPQDIRAASDVFTGTVTSVRTTGSARRGTVTYDVAVERVYRGGVRILDPEVLQRRAAFLAGLARRDADLDDLLVREQAQRAAGGQHLAPVEMRAGDGVDRALGVALRSGGRADGRWTNAAGSYHRGNQPEPGSVRQ